MENDTDISSSSEYLEYFKLVTEAVVKHGLGEEEELPKLISADDVKRICAKSFINRRTPNEAAVMIRLFLDRIYD